MHTIYSLTVNFIERFLAGKDSRSQLEALKSAIGEGRYSDALSCVGSLIEKSGLEIHDLSQRRLFVSELNFIEAVINFKKGDLSAARAGFVKCLTAPNLAAYSSLFLAAAADSGQRRAEAHGYISQYASRGGEYHYFKLIDLRLYFEDGDFEKAALGAGSLIDSLGARSGEIKLLPPVEFGVIDAFYVKSLIESIFDQKNFLYEILFIAAESNFNLERYETAFEYYKEASFCRDDPQTQASCFYKMACSKMRVSDFITARGLLEKTVEMAGGVRSAAAGQGCVLLDLANLYEYHFGETELAVGALAGYISADPSDADAVLRLSTLLYENGRYNEALVYLGGLAASGAGGFEPAFLAAKCHYSAGRYQECLDVLGALPAEGGQGGQSFEASLLAVGCAVMLNDYAAAEEALKKVSSSQAADGGKFRVAEFNMFFNYLKASPYLVCVGNESTSIFRGFVRHGSIETSPSNVSGIKAFADKVTGGSAVVLVSGAVSPTDYSLVREVFDGNLTVYEKHLGFMDPAGYSISLTENPLGITTVDPALGAFIVFVSLMGKINIGNMPSLFIESGCRSDGPGDGKYSGVLGLYELFRSGGRQFAIFSAYTRASRTGGGDGAREDEKSRLWPFIINFKNLDISSARDESEAERVLVNGSPDIFVYNYLRENKAFIDGKQGVHFFTAPGRTEHFKKILEFILKKLGYASSSVASFEDVEGLFCMKKVNELLCGPVASEGESFDILSVVLAMSSGMRAFGQRRGAVSARLMERIKFRGAECDFASCPENGLCRLGAILSGYSGPGAAFLVSPFGNYFFVRGLAEKPAAFSGFIQIFLGAAGFFVSGENYHRREVSLSSAAAGFEKAIAGGELSAAEANDFISALTALKNSAGYFNEFIRSCDDELLITGLCEAIIPRAFASGGGFRLKETAAGRLIGMARDYLSAGGTAYDARLRAEGECVIMSLGERRWADRIVFDRSVRKVFFVSEEDPGEYYEKKLSGVLKFFKRMELAEKYFQAAAITSNVIVQAENGSGYRNIINKFASNSKKAAFFFLGCPSVSADPASFGTRDILCRTIDLPSDVETDLVDLDCVVINYHYRNREHARSMLTMLKNVIVKYNVNLFWMVVSTELFENAFARGSDFLNIPRVRLYSNEIEYANAFYGERESVGFLGAQSPSGYYEGAPAVETPGKYEIYFPGFREKTHKFWRQAYENIIGRGIRTLCDESSETAEKTAFIITMMALYTRFKKHVIIYLETVPSCKRFENFLYGFELFSDSGRSERNRVLILRGREFEKFSTHEKGVRHSEALLINFQPRFTAFNSADFDAAGYFKWLDFSSAFEHSLSLVSVASSDESQLIHVTFEEFYSFVCASVRQDPRGVHLICSQPEFVESFRAEVLARLKPDSPDMEPYFISYENSAVSISAIASKNFPRPARIYLTEVSTGDVDARLAASFATEFAARLGASVVRCRVSEGGPHLKLPDIFFNEAAFAEAFVRQFGQRGIFITAEELATYLPASVFSKASASRCLAVLSRAGAIKVTGRADDDAPASAAESLHADAAFLSELNASGALRLFFTPAAGEKYSCAELLRDGLAAAGDRYELTDAFFRHAKEPLKISVSIISDEAAGMELLRKMARVRKNMLRCMYDIDGFREGKPIALPISDFHEMSPNDFCYIREFSFLQWHGACIFTRGETRNPRVKRAMSQIQIERLTETVERDLSELYAALHETEREGGLAGISLLSQLAAAVKASGAGGVRSKYFEGRPISYILRLLKHLFMYGLIVVSVRSPFDRGCREVLLEPAGPGGGIDYKAFMQACESMYRID